MTQPNFRALCAELIKIVEEHSNPDEYALCDVVDTLNRARAALATPPPEPPSEKEIELFIESIRMPWILEQISRATDPDPDFDVVIVRAALERWGK